MTNTVISFKNLTSKQQVIAGGKGGTLARMFQEGYPVPDGFVVLPSAFKDELLNDKAWDEIKLYLNNIRKNQEEVRFAVRSSALSEDSAMASFAGEFETLLNMKTDKEIKEAIYTVFKSGTSERVKTYSSVQGIDEHHHIAVVVQLMVNSELSGVLFTADPITGSYKSMTGNFVYGLGEQLVSGETNAHDFKLIRPKGKYRGPDILKKYARKLYQYAAKLEKESGNPQDIEWAVAGRKLYLLQARPITTLTQGNLDTYDMNYSFLGEELWTNTNVAEAIPDVYTPFTWSIGKQLDDYLNFIPGYYIFSGNICGRPYMNISRRVSVITSLLGRNAEGALKLIRDLYGELPEGMNMPIHPFSRVEVMKEIVPRMMGMVGSSIKASKNLTRFLNETPDWCNRMRQNINQVSTGEELLNLWKNELKPYYLNAWMSAGASAVKLTNVTVLDKKLTVLVGQEDANILLSNLRGGAGLESLGPVTGISKIVKGEMTREEYRIKYGHRGPHEYELSIPDPQEDDKWLEKQIEEFKKQTVNIGELLNKQRIQFEAARVRFKNRFPGKSKWLDKKLQKAAEGAGLREEGRSEFVRAYRLVRNFARKAGELSGMGDDIFFLYIEEIEELLAGKDSKRRFIPVRKENYEKYKALPPFPSIIKGRFNPFEWVKNPDRRLDYYDSDLTDVKVPHSKTLKGYAGAAGRIEGIVRVLSNTEEGDQLLPGEILVTATTNIGWTPLFPKVSAIITDIGAPLSHAAIVARELGIPAVVGCTGATTRLKTGDKVMVDGGKGTVQIL